MLYVTPSAVCRRDVRACIESLEPRRLLAAQGSAALAPPTSSTGNVDYLAVSSQVVASFTLVDASNGQAIPGYDSIPNGATINLAQIGKSVSIRANTDPGIVGSVKFGLDANSNFRNENAAPYAMLGNNGNVYTPWNPSNGQHTITATPFTASNSTGTVGTPLTITVTITTTTTLPTVTVSATTSTANETTGAQ